MMAVTDKIPYVVTEADAPFTYNGVCYEAGQTVPMRPIDYKACMDIVRETNELSECWPAYVAHQGAYEHKANSNQYILPPGAVVQIPIPEKSCGRPNRAYFNWCGSCFVADFDKDPVTTDVTDLQAPIQNPRFLWIGPDTLTGDRPDVIHVINKDTAEMCLTVSYFC